MTPSSGLSFAGDLSGSSSQTRRSRKRSGGTLNNVQRTCREANIRIVMITGDYGLTAEALARIVTGMPQKRDPGSAALQNVDDVTRQLAVLNDEVRSTERAIGTKTDERRSSERQIEDVQRAVDWQQGLIAQAQTEIAALAEQDVQWQAEEDRLHGEIAQYTAAIQQSNGQLNELPLETLAAQLTALQAEAAVSDQLRRSQANVVESYRSGLEQMRGQLQSRLDRAGRAERVAVELWWDVAAQADHAAHRRVGMTRRSERRGDPLGESREDQHPRHIPLAPDRRNDLRHVLDVVGNHQVTHRFIKGTPCAVARMTLPSPASLGCYNSAEEG